MVACMMRRKYRRHAAAEREAARAQQEAVAGAAAAAAAAAEREAAARGRHRQGPFVVPVVIVQPGGEVVLAEQLRVPPWPGAAGADALFKGI